MNTYRLLIIICFISFSYSLNYAQSYVPTDAKWYYNVTDVTYSHHGYRLFEYAGDTIVGSKTAMKISKVLHTTYGSVTNEGYEFLLYEDSCLFYWNTINNQYRMMFDFKLNAGDTFNINIDNNLNLCDSVSAITVLSTCYKNINGINLKKINFHYTLYYNPAWGPTVVVNDSVIERIGHIGSFIFKPACSYLDVFDYRGMRCYEDNEIGIYMVDWNYGHLLSCDTLYISVGIDEPGIKNEIISIYPNPIENYMVIDFSKFISDKSIWDIEIYSSSGKLIESGIIAGKNSLSFDMEHHKKGLYLIKISNYSHGLQITKKIIKN